MRFHFLCGLWACVVAGSLAYTAVRLSKGGAVDTSLLSLLPASEGDPLLTQAHSVLSQRASRLMGFVVGHPQAETAIEMGEYLKEQLRKSGFIRQSLTDLSPEQQKAFYDLYFPFRYQMLSPPDRERLKSEKPMDFFITRLTASLYGPASSFLKTLIPQDPFLFFPELVRSWAATAAPAHAAESADGIALVDTDGRSYTFAAVELALDPFDSKNQDRMMAWLTDLRKDILGRWPASRLDVSGVLPFASAERLRTEREMTMVSVGSLVGVLLLTFLIFATLRALLLAVLPIAAGFLVAAAATLLWFGNIHIITLAFGSSLIGVAVDYPLLYLASHRTAGRQWEAQAALRQILPGLLFGAVTTLLGYIALSVAPFPGLRQMALFSSVGLCAALITVILWLPGFLKQGSRLFEEPRILAKGKSILTRVHRGRMIGDRKGWTIGAVLLAIFIIGGLALVRFDDDIRRLQRPPESVVQEDAVVRKAMKGFGGSRFILVRGSTLEELLQRQERLQETLHPFLISGALSSIQSLAPFVPSLQRQEEDRRLLQAAFLSKPDNVGRRLNAVGLKSEIADRFLKDLRQPLLPFSMEQWLASPASQLLRSLWIGPTRHGWASAVLLGGLEETAPIKEAMKPLAGIRFFDQIEEYTALFRRYRHLGIGLIGAAYLGVWGLMMFRYGAVRGTWVTAPSVAGVLCTFAIFGWCGMKIHLIHCLSALLVLSMGIDYTIYFAECHRAGRPVDSTLLAVELCAACALLSFGLLALCRTPVLSSIGLTVFTGMAVAFLLSPLPYLDADA